MQWITYCLVVVLMFTKLYSGSCWYRFRYSNFQLSRLSARCYCSSYQPHEGIRLLQQDDHTILIWKASNVGVSKKDALRRSASVPIEEWMLTKKIGYYDIFPPIGAQDAGLVYIFMNPELLSFTKANQASITYTYACLIESSTESLPPASQEFNYEVESRCKTERETPLFLIKMHIKGADYKSPKDLGSGLEKQGYNLYKENGKPLIALIGLEVDASKRIEINGKIISIKSHVDIPRKFYKAIKREELRFERQGGVKNPGESPLVQFRNMSFTISDSALVPRKSSGILIDVGLELLRKKAMSEECGGGASIRILELGCGCGVIILSLLNELVLDTTFRKCSIQAVGVDIDSKALLVARSNAEQWRGSKGIGAIDSFHIHFLNKDFNLLHQSWPWIDLNGCSLGSYDLILCNPPYLSEAAAKARITQEGRLALMGGFDGLDAYRNISSSILNCIPDILDRKGALVFQAPGGGRGAERVAKVVQLIEGLQVVDILADDRGVRRCVTICRSAE